MTLTTLFVADLHIGGEQPLVTDRFIEFLQTQANHAEALYILGDLFEVWLGDDAVQPEQRKILDALKQLSQHGVAIFVMRGNRDVLLGQAFEKMSGCRLLDDPTVIDLYGQKTLLTHGDILCTDDGEYQQFRSMVHNPKWQQQFLSNSIEQRITIARQYRSESSARNQQKTAAIMDVNSNAVIDMMQKHGVNRLIHGHTHRPAVHDLAINSHPAQRIVVGDWLQQNSQLICDEHGCQLVNSN